MIDVIKEISSGIIDSRQLSDVLIGEVESVSPFRIRINEKLVLNENVLVFSKTVLGLITNFALEDIDTRHSHPSTSFDNQTNHMHSFDGGETRETEISTTHEHGVAGSIYNAKHRHDTEGINEGDYIILIKASGGQKFFVIDKVGEIDDSY